MAVSGLSHSSNGYRPQKYGGGIQLYSKSKKLKIPFTNAICPSTRINRHSSIGEGNVICSLTHIGTCSSIGNNNFISSQTNIEHHNVWGSHITTGPNCNTSSRVKIDDCVKFGMGIYPEKI